MNIQPLIEFLIDIPKRVIEFGSWLTTPLDKVNLSPLALLSLTGISVILTIHILKLFIDW